MSLRLALAVRGTSAGHRLGALEGGEVPPSPFQCIAGIGIPPLLLLILRSPLQLPALGLYFNKHTTVWGQSRLVCAAYPDWYLACDTQLHPSMVKQASLVSNSLILASVQGGRFAALLAPFKPHTEGQGNVGFDRNDTEWNAVSVAYPLALALPLALARVSQNAHNVNHMDPQTPKV